ncbi:aklavinone 12-hydroxylase RdmE [Saccharothrix texasensis]|uniref:Aklavinone 12-hydroxylase n=1 Tax=Saccharothrix texasensis TaxID=103734 RepID=A0A3N1HCS3_9PSEU|nr:FAD-dependent monooxygenase [Saccharothrix texasensis]ROP40291.1 aklavinone 12-hydroxylase [Saccharothrix texasensis]
MGDDRRVQVLVVGAGLSGLTAALFLAQQGVSVLGISKHRGTSPHPKATGQTHRTMEVLRRAGVADEVLAGEAGLGGGLVIKVAESLRGRVFHSIVHEDDEWDATLSPERPALASQDHVEPVLLRRARELGAEVLFETELVSLAQDDDGVTARVRSAGDEYAVRADYVIGADGHRGVVRGFAGIGRQGPGELTRHVGVVFDADLTAHIVPDKLTLFYLRNPAFTGAFVATNTARRNVFTIEYDPARESAADYPVQRCVELLRIATDAPDLEPDVLEVTAWEMAAWVSDRFRAGRVFLVGDAAKVTPPTGGLGGNTAIGDGFDLAWKLAEVLKGEAGVGLLDSYEAERRPYAKLVVDGSYANYVQRFAPHLAGPDVPAEVDPMHLTLGYRCRSNAVLIEDTDPSPMEDPADPSARPGFRAPHVVVTHNGREVSTVDLFRTWTLVTLNPDWRAVAAPSLHVPAVTDPTGALSTRYRIGRTGAALVRPDGVIAHHTTNPPASPTALTTTLHTLKSL